MREVVNLLRALFFAVTTQCKFKLAHTLAWCCHFVTYMYVHTVDERARTMLHLHVFINTVVEIINNGQNYGVSTYYLTSLQRNCCMSYIYKVRALCRDTAINVSEAHVHIHRDLKRCYI